MRWIDTVPIEVLTAYRSVFGQDRTDVHIVLQHMAGHCKFYQYEVAGVSAEQLNHDAGRRAAYAPIFESLSLSDEQLAALMATKTAAEQQ